MEAVCLQRAALSAWGVRPAACSLTACSLTACSLTACSL